MLAGNYSERRRTHPIQSVQESVKQVGGSHFLWFVDLIVHLVENDLLGIGQTEANSH
jgi:hypothetical protein